MKMTLILLVGMLGTTPALLITAEREQCPVRECTQRISYQGRFIEHYFSHFPNQLITCPFCRTYQTKNLKKLANHSFSLGCKGERNPEERNFESLAFTNCPICNDEVRYFDFFRHITGAHPPGDSDLAPDRTITLSIAPPEHRSSSDHDDISLFGHFYNSSGIRPGEAAESYPSDFDNFVNPDFSTLFDPSLTQPQDGTLQLDDLLSPNTVAFLNRLDQEQSSISQKGHAPFFDDFSELLDPSFAPKQSAPNAASTSLSVPLARRGNPRTKEELCFDDIKVPLLCSIEGCPSATASKMHTRHTLQKHYRTKHPEEGKINYSIFLCVVCKTNHHGKEAFIHHMGTHTREDFVEANGFKTAPMLPPQNEEDIETYLQGKGIEFRCPKKGCRISLPTLIELTEHCRHLHQLPISLEDESYHCSLCDLTLHKPKALCEHIHDSHPYEKKPSTFVKALFSITKQPFDKNELTASDKS